MKALIQSSVLVGVLCVPTVGCSEGDAARLPNRPDAGGIEFTNDAMPSEVPSDVHPDVVKNDATEAGLCSDPSEPDMPDALGEDSNCDGADGTLGIDVYVNPENGDDSNSGTPQSPVATLERAVELARARDGSVLVSAGVLAPNPLSLDTDLRVFGGYDSSFLGKPERHETTIKTGAEGWSIESIGSVELHGLTVLGANAQFTTTEHAASTFALVLDVSDALLQDVNLEAGDAVSGINGEPGEAGERGIDAINGMGAEGLKCSFSAQPDFTNGADQNRANACGQPAGDSYSAIPPQTGHAGYAGTDGSNADGVPDLDDGTLFFGVASPGIGDGTPGFGGPGGDYIPQSNHCIKRNGLFYDVRGGGGGTGGCPGQGGQPGTSGGGSVALLVRTGTVTIQGSRLATGFGGAGGDGGRGGTGGDGGNGAVPKIRSHVLSCYGESVSVEMNATCPPDSSGFNCAGYGAAGGKGGEGGHGGGGAGGWTIGVLTVGAAAAHLDGATVLDLGKPGTGGMGGVARAPDGQKSPIHHIDL